MPVFKIIAAALATFLSIFILTSVATIIPPISAAMSSMMQVSRDAEAYSAHMSFLFLGHFMQSLVFVALFLFTKTQHRGLKSGVLFGVIVGSFLAFTNTALYSMLDIQFPALLAWGVTDLVNFTFSGFLISLILRSKVDVAQTELG